MPKAAEFPIEGKEGGRLGGGGGGGDFDENKGSRPLPSFVGILQPLGSFYSANLRSSLSYRGAPTPEAISNGSIVCCRRRIAGRKQTGRQTFTTIRTTGRRQRRERKERPQPFSLQKNLTRSHGQRQQIYLRNFGTFYVPERRGKGLPEILFSATVLRCIAEFFLDKRRECGQQPVSSLPPFFLLRARRAFFPQHCLPK